MAVDFTGLDSAHPCKGCRQCLTTDDLCAQCKALADCRSGSAQMAKWLEDNRLELTAIRSELAAAKEQRWQLESLIVDAHFRAFGARHYAYVDPKSACDLLVADIAATQHEREKSEAENAALKAHVERLRVAASDYYQRYMLDEAADEEHCVCGKPQHLRARAVGEAILETPAQSLAAVKAEVLLDACKDREHGGLCQRVAVDYLDWTGKEPLASQLHARPMFRLSVLDADEVMKMAERLQAEAANGTT